MAVVKPGQMSGSSVVAARATITAADADYNHAIGDAVDGTGLRRVLVLAKRTAGGVDADTISVEPCLHAVVRNTSTGAVTASYVLRPAAATALADGDHMIVEVYGRSVTLHVTAVTAGTWTLFVGTYEPFWADAPRLP